MWSKEAFRPGGWTKLGESEGEGLEDDEGKHKVDLLIYICISNSTSTSRFPFEMWLKCVRRDENSGRDLPKVQKAVSVGRDVAKIENIIGIIGSNISSPR